VQGRHCDVGLAARTAESDAGERDRLKYVRHACVRGSHPFAENAKGWGIRFSGASREIKNLLPYVLMWQLERPRFSRYCW